MNTSARCIVLGAGVSGLSCAVRLLDARYNVEVWARDRGTNTVSSVAAAIWFPYRVGPKDKVERWGAVARQEFERLALIADTGVSLCHGVADGDAMQLPVADMTLYLTWLERQVLNRGGTFHSRTVATLSDLVGAADLVVNCTGLGARELANDSKMYGVRGQIQIVDAPQIRTFIIDDDTYVIPRVSGVVLGGTADEYQEDTKFNADTARDIRDRCVQRVPTLADVPVIANRVGVRPCRHEVRLEAEVIEDQWFIHNYGHGGAGVTLSWGCADDVVALARTDGR